MKNLTKALKTTLIASMALLSAQSLSACNRVNPALINRAGLNQNQVQPVGSTRYAQSSSNRAGYVPNQLVVQFRSVPNPGYLQQFSQQNGLQALQVSRTGAVLFRQLNPANTGVVMQSLRTNSMVEYSHQNTYYRRLFTMNDSRSSEQYGPAIVGLSKAWDITLGSPNVVIAVVDSGVDLEHPDLKANLVPGFNALNEGQSPQDDNEHGTHAAGIAGAVGDNGVGVTGACPRCKIMPVKVLDSEGGGTGFGVAAGVVWAVDNGAQIINLSLGGKESDPTMERAIKYALSRNAVVVVAAGNDNTDAKMYPAALPGVISVGSVDKNRNRSSFSNYGTWVSVMAPGSDILSTIPTSMGEYTYMDGTSMAAPLVAGIVGLMKSRFPQLTPAQVKARLEGTAIDLGTPGFDAEYAHGMVDSLRALL